MQKTFGFKPLCAADGPVKTAIFGGNSMRLYNFERDKIVLLEKPDRIAAARAKYEEAGPELSMAASDWAKMADHLTPSLSL
jgi:hypothetical protein